ncbi:HAMP domain-containing sensor histidine kinase [Beijerinckia sp. L45]|uniref:sensor histidine kinase n=1 Tax=Beijerinckia sp. L45 TaxID=1641855 RepID=UPI00131DE6BE|nr:ATP-binding protein [Beijerinckia sp. L45]
MILIRRRLFWKIYLTLLASLVTVALVMGCFWWFLGETQHGWSEATPAPAVDRDVSVYAPTGALLAERGNPIALDPGGIESRWTRRRLLRVDLPDGRIVLTRLRPPSGAMMILTVMLIVAGGIGLAAFPVTARLTRSLEALRFGAARWGAGDLAARVDETGSDEVALVARAFNTAAARLEALLASHKTLLANAGHELRSPLARLRIAIELWLHNPAEATQAEIIRNLAEVDQLVDEILLSSRLDHPGAARRPLETVDILGLVAEEAARVGVTVDGKSVDVAGDPVLLRRLFRNLLENGLKHGEPPIGVTVAREMGEARITVSDGGPGIPEAERARIFEPFYRPAGRSEAAGGWGLGLALVQQIAAHHGGHVTCGTTDGGGSRFVVFLLAD